MLLQDYLRYRLSLTPFFVGKDKEKNIVTQMKEKYNIPQDKYDFDITTINDQGVRFAAKVLLSKMLQKMRSNHCTTGIIVAVEQCVVGVQMNWAMFLLNELVEVIDAQEQGTPFTYS